MSSCCHQCATAGRRMNALARKASTETQAFGVVQITKMQLRLCGSWHLMLAYVQFGGQTDQPNLHVAWNDDTKPRLGFVVHLQPMLVVNEFDRSQPREALGHRQRACQCTRQIQAVTWQPNQRSADQLALPCQRGLAVGRHRHLRKGDARLV